MTFPLIGAGAAKAAPVFQVPPFLPPVKFLSVTVGWNPTTDRWKLTTPGVVVWRQMYATSRQTGGSSGSKWGQFWPQGVSS